MSSELNLSVPEVSNSKSGKPSKTVTVLLALVLIAVIINIGIVFLLNANRNASVNSFLPQATQKKLALKLEEQGLYDTAIEAWKVYLAEAAHSAKDRAMIWYRIGKLYQKKGDYEHALSGYYRSESHANVEDISDEIARNVSECLELMGKFTALSHELRDRVGMAPDSDNGKKTSDETVLAEIGPQKITRQDFKQHIESQIDRQMAQFASHLPLEQRNKQKEALLKQVASPEKFKMLLNQYVLEEVLYRKAREENLTDDPEIRSLLSAQEKALLSRMVIEKEYKRKINITDSDLETYYKANEDHYIVPERVRISHILVKDKTSADYIHVKLKNGEDFGKLAEEMSLDEATKRNQGKISDWVVKGKAIPGIGPVKEAMGDLDDQIFSTPAGEVVEKNLISEKGVHIIKVLEKEDARKQTFEEVKNEVYQTLRTRKEQEIQQRLLNELKTAYDVVIHQSAFLNMDPKPQRKE